jgi:hypothetical protein
VTTCHGDDGQPVPGARPTAARLSVSYGYAHTVLSFDGQVRADFSRHAVSVAGERPIGERGVAVLGAGGIADGTLDTGEAYSMGPGWLFFGAYGHRLVDERGAWPFVLGTVSVGATAARTSSARGESAHFTAYDVRAGATVGKVFGPLTPYVAARVFGGPVLWTQHGQHLTGTDKYHYQPALGLVLAKAPFDVSFEWAFAGERALTAGAGISF